MLDPIAILVRQTKHLPDGTYLLAVQMEGHVLLLHQKIVEMDFVYDPKMPPKGTFGWDIGSIQEAKTRIKTLATKVVKLEDFENGEYAYDIHETKALPAPIEQPRSRRDWTIAKLSVSGFAFCNDLKSPPYIAELQKLRETWNTPAYINALACRKVFSGTPEYAVERLQESGFLAKVLYHPNNSKKSLGVYFATTDSDLALCETLFGVTPPTQTLPDIPQLSGLPVDIHNMVKEGYEFSKQCGETPSLLKLKRIAESWEGLAFINAVTCHKVFGLSAESFSLRLTHAGIPARILEDTQNDVTRVVGVVFSHEAYELDHAAHKFAALREAFGG